MRATSRCLGSLVAPMFLLAAALAQTNPPPSDPHEMVTRDPHMLSKQADRSVALDLLSRARKNFDLHSVGAPYSLKISFESNGVTQNEGAGTIEELSDGDSHWRWTAQLQDSHVVRLGADGRVYGSSGPIPLRVQLARSLVFRPIQHDVAKFEIRSADVERGGKSMTCLLLSYSLPPNPAPRAWVEREQCIDPATGLLQMWSEAPGIYALYEYGVEFHGHILPRQISVFEEGRQTMLIHVESLEDAPSLDANLFKPAPEMADTGETFQLTSAGRIGPLRVDPSDAPTSRFYQVVIVHAILDAQDGTVLDAEALQDSKDDLGRAALDLVKNTSFDPTGFQQEMFIGVHFHLPAARFGGEPIAVLHSRVHWVLVDHRVKSPPMRPHPGK
jgi:hypothetical protein